MKLRVLMPYVLGAIGALSASLGQARHIAVDFTMTCGSGPLSATSSGLISNLAGTGAGNSANSGVNDLVWACPDSTGMDSNASYFSFNPTSLVNCGDLNGQTCSGNAGGAFDGTLQHCGPYTLVGVDPLKQFLNYPIPKAVEKSE